MRWCLRILVSFALLLGLALPSAAQPAPAPPTTSPADFQRLLDSVVATGAPGAIGSLEDDGRAWSTGRLGRWSAWPSPTTCCSRRARPSPTPTPTTWWPAC